MDEVQQPTAAGHDALTQYRLTMIEKTLEAIRDNLTQLAQLEQKHVETREALARAFKQIDMHDNRIRNIEGEMPTLKLTRGWIISGVVALVAMMGLALFKLFSFTGG